jgi:hypothetical protein
MDEPPRGIQRRWPAASDEVPRRDPVNGSIPITMDRNAFRKARAETRWQGIKIGLGLAGILVATDVLWPWLR